MYVEFDISSMLKSGLDLERYILLKLLYNEETKAIEEFTEACNISTSDFKILESLDFIKIVEQDIIFLDKTKQLFTNTEKYDFSELYTAYPVKTISGRVLRTVDIDTELYKSSLKKYKSKVKTKEKHDKIVSIVKKYLEVAPKDNLNYLRAIDAFINNSEWEKMEAFLLTNKIQDMREIV